MKLHKANQPSFCFMLLQCDFSDRLQPAEPACVHVGDAFFLPMALSKSIGGSQNTLLKMKDAAPSLGQLGYYCNSRKLAA